MKDRRQPAYLVKSPSLPHGSQPPQTAYSRSGRGRLLFHAIGCRVDGGPGLPPGVCLKCLDTARNRYFEALMRSDRRVS